jgi:hypothetical protein
MVVVAHFNMVINNAFQIIWLWREYIHISVRKLNSLSSYCHVLTKSNLSHTFRKCENLFVNYLFEHKLWIENIAKAYTTIRSHRVWITDAQGIHIKCTLHQMYDWKRTFPNHQVCSIFVFFRQPLIRALNSCGSYGWLG